MLQPVEQPLVYRPQQEGGAADPVGQGRAIERDALPRIDLSLPIQRQMIGVFGDENLRHRRLGRQPTLNQPRRRCRLHNSALAGPTGIFGPTHNKHAELGRDDVESFADILANPMQCVAAAWAGMIVDVDHHLNARQMLRQRSTVDATLGGMACALGWCRRFVLGFAARHSLFDFFEAEQQLIFRQRLGPSAKAVTLQLLNDLLQPFGARTFRQQHRLERAGVVGKRIRRRHHDASTSCAAAPCEHFDPADSLCRRSTRLYRRRGLARGVNPSPIESFQQC